MKLRIHENSIRLRVSRPELSQLRSRGRIDAELHIAAQSKFTYTLKVTVCESISAEFHDGHMTVELPQDMAAQWYSDSEVSVHGEQVSKGGPKLEVLIEKDFTCLAPREGEDQSDLFPNPVKR